MKFDKLWITEAEAIAREIRGEKKIGAIKALREATGLDLMDAKQVMDRVFPPYAPNADRTEEDYERAADRFIELYAIQPSRTNEEVTTRILMDHIPEVFKAFTQEKQEHIIAAFGKAFEDAANGESDQALETIKSDLHELEEDITKLTQDEVFLTDDEIDALTENAGDNK